MALDMFLDIKGEITGEAQDKVHKGEIDVLAWSMGLSNGGSFHVGGGGGSGKANFQDISVTKWIDLSSATLALYCANGQHFEGARLVVRKAGKNPLEYLVIEMEKVLITSVSTGGSGGEDRLTENITLNYAKINVEYKEQKPDGSGGPTKSLNWNVPENHGGA